MSRVIELVAKLHAKARSARDLGQHAEADSFDRKVLELLEREGLTLADVEADVAAEGERVQPTMLSPEDFGEESTDRALHPWKLHLAMVVAARHECAVISFLRHNGIGFVGVVEDRDVAVEMFKRLVVRLEEMARREIDKPQASGQVLYSGAASNAWSNASSSTASFSMWMSWEPPRDELWRISYLCGAAQAIGDRLHREFQEKRARAAASGFGLVPIGKRVGLRQWIAERSRPPEPDPSADGEPFDPDPVEHPGPEPVSIREDGFAEGARAAWALNLQAFELTADAST